MSSCACSRGSSASDSTSIDSSDDDGEQPMVRRVYNVTGSPNDRESDDALPSSNVSSDNEEEVDGKSSADEKEREEEESSSGSADTDSNDTGTVADQKPKRFRRVFVVNHKGPNSSSSGSVSSSGDSDSSDNDTDTELDCSVVLTHVKLLSSEVVEDLQQQPAESSEGENGELPSGEASFLSLKYIGDDLSAQYYKKAAASTSAVSKSKSRRFGSKSKKKQESEAKAPRASESDKDIVRKFIEAEAHFASELLENPSSSNAAKDCDKMPDVDQPVAEQEKTCESTVKNRGEPYGYSSSPGLSDVSAESLSSSDVEKESSRYRKEWGGGTGDKDDAIGAPVCENETESGAGSACGDLTGVQTSVIDEPAQVDGRHGVAAKYTSLVMITNDAKYQQVNIVTSDTTKVVPGEVVVSHTNRQDEASMDKLTELGEYHQLIQLALNYSGAI